MCHDGPDCKHQPHGDRPGWWAAPPWGFWLSVVLALLTGVMSLLRTNLDVRDLMRRVDQLDEGRYSEKDAERDQVLQRKYDARQSDSISELCDELRRLQRELGRIPTENCEPPE
jgi:hypothetical protein